ncbi:hypothetical protein LINGRAHAP2_LOCUS17935 [Linum grandiflorum]
MATFAAISIHAIHYLILPLLHRVSLINILILYFQFFLPIFKKVHKGTTANIQGGKELSNQSYNSVLNSAFQQD